ncbi:MAG: M4 family metallopeptidase [Bacteroidales bacterium]|jgi:hypothetical protein|nr:M4 family metallopeptidase [Bacteroidales bacterium]
MKKLYILIFFAIISLFTSFMVQAQMYFPATLHTYYYGTRDDLETFYNPSFVPPFYSLRNRWVNVGQGVYYNGNPFPYIDYNNQWEIVNHYADQHAQDAFWSANKCRQYFYDKHGRASFNCIDCDNPRPVAVVVDANNFPYNSSMWVDNCHRDDVCIAIIYLGQREGDSYYNYVTALDIIAHEYAHGVENYSSNFAPLNGTMFAGKFQYLSDGLSDIWAMVIEHEYVPDGSLLDDGTEIGVKNWQIGELSLRGCLRNIANPSDPSAVQLIASSYLQEGWDEGDDTFKSGVFSRWFYYLVGGIFQECLIETEGIGWDEAAQIVYKTQTEYIIDFLNIDWDNPPLPLDELLNYSYPQVRNATIAAATALFGADSPQVNAVIMAWDAVNVPFSPDFNDSNFYIIEEDETIVENTTWGENLRVLAKANITVASGVNLTIKGTVYFKENTGLTVNPGATLTINGGYLTVCGETYWKGIVVKGDPNNMGYRGRVFMTPRTTEDNVIFRPTIEQALTGILIPYNNTSGHGTVSARDADFINNRLAVSIPADNNVVNSSNFTNCLFKVDQNFTVPSLIAERDRTCMVYLKEVKGINFHACTFLKENVTTPQRGIEAHNAGFSVKAFCDYPDGQTPGEGEPCPEMYLARSAFSGFDIAILAENHSSIMNTFSVNQANFDNNRVGIEASGIRNAAILQNHFNIGSFNSVDDARVLAYGVRLLSSSEYRVEENHFAPTLNAYGTKIGVYVEESGPNENVIYFNDFQDLDIANRLTGINRKINDYGKTGLQVLCNQFDNTAKTDVEVLNSGIQPTHSGIRIKQGGVFPNGGFIDFSAGNLFSLDPEYHYYNATQFTIDYYYNPAVSREKPTRIFEIFTYASNPSLCPTRITRDDIDVADYLEGLLDEQESADEAYDALQYVYHNQLDGGSTEELLHQVQGSWGDDVWKLRQELISKSPYLSQEVLKEVAKENLLPQALYLEICLANPDAVKDGKFIDFLAEDIPNPLPNYMLNLIKESGNTKTVRTTMEAVMSAFSAKSSVALNQYVGYLLMDSINHSADVTAKWAARGSYSDVLALATDKLSIHEYASAYDMVYALLNNPAYVEYYENEINDFMDYILYRETLHDEDISVYELDSIQLADLIAFSSNHTGIGKRFADNILCYTYNLCPEDEEYVEPKRLNHSNANKHDSKFDHFFVQIKPNPADTYCEFEWNFGDMEGVKTLTITGVNGTTILSRLLSNSQGQWVWDTRGLISGFYIYSVYKDGILLETGKIVKK